MAVLKVEVYKEASMVVGAKVDSMAEKMVEEPKVASAEV